MLIPAELTDITARHSMEGYQTTALPRISIIRADRPVAPHQGFYEPLFYIILQGSKRVVLESGITEYTAGQYLIPSIEQPIVSEIFEASPDKPYLGVCLSFDSAVLASVLDERSEASDTAMDVEAGDVDEQLGDVVLRLMRLLDRPSEAGILFPLIERELLFRLVMGRHGPALRQISLADSRMARINRIVAWIRRNFRDAFTIDTLAAEVGLSASTLHRHFKAVTSMTPVQYQKCIRLQEARRLLTADKYDAGSIGLSVGYESQSQFTKEYRRFFGITPGKDRLLRREVRSVQ